MYLDFGPGLEHDFDFGLDSDSGPWTVYTVYHGHLPVMMVVIERYGSIQCQTNMINIK